MTELKGVGASKGMALGNAFVIEEMKLPQQVVSKGSLEELQQLEQSKLAVESKINQQIANSLSHEGAEILGAHLLFLNDPEWLTQAQCFIQEGMSAYNAVKASGDAFAMTLDSLEDAYLKERAADVRAVTTQWLATMLGYEDKPLPAIGPVVLVAEDLSPVIAAALNPDIVVGIVTHKGGKTSHTAIIANNLGIPAVLGIKANFNSIQDQQLLAVDGTQGLVMLEPDADKQVAINQAIQDRQRREALEAALKDLKAQTKDGHPIEVSANIGSAEEAAKAVANGAEGVGLFRTEFVYMDQNSFPSVEAQSRIYIDAVKRLDGRPMIFRTFDIGGDKSLSYFPIPEELNPFMGYRALRICLKEEALFLTQLKAMLIASSYGPCQIMFPMVSSLEEFRLAKLAVQRAMVELDALGIAYDREIPLGIMVEVPSVAAAAQLYAKEVDFFSVGTNDLTQYTLAVDRMNEAIAELYDPFNPGVIHLLANTYAAANQAGIMGGMCGEMAGNVLALPLLVGLGIHELSMSPKKIPSIKAALSQFTLKEAQELAAEVLTLGTSSAIQDTLSAFLSQRRIDL